MVSNTSEIENYKSCIKTIIDYARGQKKENMTIEELEEEFLEWVVLLFILLSFPHLQNLWWRKIGDGCISTGIQNDHRFP